MQLNSSFDAMIKSYLPNFTGVREDMLTALEPTAMDTTAMVSMNDMHLNCVDLCWGCYWHKMPPN